MILVTGGAGFIGANFVLDWLDGVDEAVINVDKLTYSGHLGTLRPLHGDPSHIFVRADICDRSTIDVLLADYQPRAIVHFAAQNHVDYSIDSPNDFVHTNIVGTYTLLEAARCYWNGLQSDERRVSLSPCLYRRGVRLPQSERSAIFRRLALPAG